MQTSSFRQRPGRAAGTRVAASLAVVLWLLTVGTGMAYLMRYEQAPGAAAQPNGPRWPTGTVARLSDADYTVVMFAHPRCPCTHASLTELQQVELTARGRAKCEVFFMLPTGADAGWRHTANQTQAAAIPNTQLFDDYDGRQAAAFGAQTSGQVFIYDRTGALRFQGGITDGRGLEGENPGLNAALCLVQSDALPGYTGPVYGCPLHDVGDQVPVTMLRPARKPL